MLTWNFNRIAVIMLLMIAAYLLFAGSMGREVFSGGVLELPPPPVG